MTCCRSAPGVFQLCCVLFQSREVLITLRRHVWTVYYVLFLKKWLKELNYFRCIEEVLKCYQSFFVHCMYTCICESVYRCTRKCVHECGSQRLMVGVFLSCSPPYFWDSLLTEPGASQRSSTRQPVSYEHLPMTTSSASQLQKCKSMSGSFFTIIYFVYICEHTCGIQKITPWELVFSLHKWDLGIELKSFSWAASPLIH